MRKYLTHLIGATFLLLGILLFVRVVNQVGIDLLWSYLKKLNWEILVVLVFPVSWTFAQALAWQKIISHDGVHVRLFDIMLVKTIGEAVNTITPLNFIGGDPFRAYLLQKKISTTVSSASVVIDRTLFFFATVILIFCGWIAALVVLPLTPEMRGLFLAATLALLTIMIILMRLQKGSPLQKLGKIAGKIPGLQKKMVRMETRLLEIDDELKKFYERSPAHLVAIVFLHFIGRALGIIEILIIAAFLGHPLSFVTGLLLTTLTILINLVFSFIPQAMGVMEGGYAGYFKHFGSGPPALGTSIQIVRRIRTVFWTILGMGCVWVYRSGKKLYEG